MSTVNEDTDPIIFRLHPRYPGYRFGNDGSIWSEWCKGGKHGLYKSLYWTKLNPVPNVKTGHLAIRLIVNGVSSQHEQKGVHVLILECFRGLAPKGMECLHNDGNPRNNKITNLRWGTRKENIADAIKHGVFKFPPILKGAKNGNSISYRRKRASSVAVPKRKQNPKTST